MTEPADNPKPPLLALQELDEVLRGFIARRVKTEDVEDLLQECFLKVVRSLPQLRDEDRLASWMFQIARNVVVDHLRSRQNRPQDLADQDVSDPGSRDDAVSKLDGWMGILVDQLPPKYADVLRSSELDERPHREIAEQLGLSVSGVKSRVQRGRALLRERIDSCCKLEFDRRGGLYDIERHEHSTDRCTGPDGSECC